MTRMHLFLGAAALGLSVLATGCAENHPSQIPAAATLRTEGTKHLTFTAPADGVAYVYDDSTDKLIWSGGMLKDQPLTLETSNDQIKVGDRLVSQSPLTHSDTYRIYFDRGAVVVP